MCKGAAHHNIRNIAVRCTFKTRKIYLCYKYYGALHLLGEHNCGALHLFIEHNCGALHLLGEHNYLYLPFS